MQKVTVIIPCFNYGHFLSETIESVINQTYKFWECLIINDGSCDNTEEIAKLYCSKDERIKLFSKTNEGLSSARNFGLNRATGNYIQFLDADDIIEPEKFRLQLEIFNENPGITICYSDFDFFEDSAEVVLPKEKNRRIRINENAYEDFLFNWGNGTLNIPSHCALIRRDFLEDFKIRFNEGLKAVEDWYFWVEVSRNGAKFCFIDKVLALYRRHSSSMAQDSKKMTYNYIYAVFDIYNSIEERYKKSFIQKFAESLYESQQQERNKANLLKNSLFYKTGEFIILPLVNFKKSIKQLLGLIKELC